MTACVKRILFSAVCFLLGGMFWVNWECMRPKEQMLVYAVHEFPLHHHEFGVWCAMSARRVWGGAMFFSKKRCRVRSVTSGRFFSPSKELT